MSEQYTLDAQVRTVFGKKVKTLRKNKIVPAVIYGAEIEPAHIQLNYRAVEILLQKAGNTHIVTVNLEGKVYNTLVRAVQRDKIRREIEHVDFLRVNLTKKRRTEVPLTFVHAPKLGSDLMLVHNLTTIEVESLPTNIPDHIEVNISALTRMGAKITVAELPELANVEILTDPHTVIARIDSFAALGDETVEGEGIVAEPEVIEKGKKEEEDF